MTAEVAADATVLVLTALPVEITAVLARVSDTAPQMAGPVLCEIGQFEALNGLCWRVVTVELGPGTVDTAAAVVAMTTEFAPEIVMFVGIAGALKDDVDVGDVVAASSVCWTERGKASAIGYLPRVQTVSLSYPLIQCARRVAREGKWTRRLAVPGSAATAVVGKIASGEKVVADKEYRDELCRTFSDAIAVENEGFGMARAAEIYASSKACVIRGISDNADPAKGDHDQPAAADAAAAFAFELLDAYGSVAAAGAFTGVASPELSLRKAPPQQVGTADAAGQVVVGQIPREPPAFVGRLALAELDEAAGRGQAAVVYAVTGLRGVGKTQLAAAYARDRIRSGWGLVGWVNAETTDAMLAGLARIAERLGVADPEGDSAESARRLREHLEVRKDHALLVFDNTADPDALLPFLPAAGGTVIVITSVNRSFAELGQLIDISCFTRAESLEYLAARTGLADQAGAAAVADELGSLPLGLAQAAATISGQHLSYRAYLKRLRGVPVARLVGRVPGGDYPSPVAAALLLNVHAAEADDLTGLTSRLLRLVAALSPDGVRRALIDGLSASAPGELEMEAVDAAVGRCVADSLLAWPVSGDVLTMHRLLGRVLRERDQASGQWTDTVSQTLDLLEPLLFGEDQAWARREEGADLAAQVEALWQADMAAGPGAPALTLRQLRARSWAVRQLRAAADLSRAIDLAARTLADSELILGADHSQVLTAQANLAAAWESARRLDQAIPLYEQTAADRARILGADHPDTLGSRSDIAGAYRSAGRLGEAIALYEQNLADRERLLGADHPDTLNSRNNLAGAYRAAGRVGEAIALYEQNLADRERLLGTDHRDAMTSRNDLAVAYRAAGRVGEAIALYEQNLADRERLLGADHPDTLNSRNNLAGAYRAAGRVGEAIALYEQNLADRRRVLGPDHPDTLKSQAGLESARHQARDPAS